MKTDRKPRKITAATFSQCIFLTFKYFIQNRLLSFAGACSFSFYFSAVPVFTMIIMIFINILHTNPSVIISIANAFPEIKDFIDTEALIKSIQEIHRYHTFDIFLALFIFWMSRRFFASITDSLQNIFHNQAKRKALINQIFTFIIEIITVLTICAIVFAFLSLQTLSSRPELTSIPLLSSLSESSSLRMFQNFLLFAIVMIFYKSNSGTNPKLNLCIACALLCTLSFLAFRVILTSLLNVSRYNLIYGVLGNVIIILVEIYVFFTLFLFFAQLIFTIQFFHELLLGELYLLPKIDTKGFGSAARRLLFVRPDYLIANGILMIHMQAGETLFTAGDFGSDAFYISKGCVKISYSDSPDDFALAHSGEFLGETSCILNQTRRFTVSAETSADVVKIDSETFKFLVHQNSEAARKVLSQITSCFD